MDDPEAFWNYSAEKVEVRSMVGIQIGSKKMGLPCGSEFDIKTELMKGVDVPCPCGNPKHWLVRWV